jgi:hypothetical protein
MASVMSKYRDRIESPEKDNPPIASPPSGHAEPYPGTQAAPPDAPKPEPVAAEQSETPTPAEQPTTEKSPADQAAQNAIRQRLAEMNHAQELTRASTQQQPQLAEPEQPQDPVELVLANSGLPERACVWLRQHPEYMSDPEKNSELQFRHHQARREAGSEFTDEYYDCMDRLLGLRQQAQPNGNGSLQPAAQRQPAPVRQQQRVGAPVSAPPTREIPSMSTGRPSTFRAPLTAAQKEIARSSGISDREYSEQLEKMRRLQAAGAIQNG